MGGREKDSLLRISSHSEKKGKKEVLPERVKYQEEEEEKEKERKKKKLRYWRSPNPKL